jgi:protein-disulfide isomerase
VLYSRQAEWAELSDEEARTYLSKLAAEFEADGAGFDACLRENRFDADVQADISEGDRLGVSATPTFFINDKKMTGFTSPEAFRSMLDEALVDAVPAVNATNGTTEQ